MTVQAKAPRPSAKRAHWTCVSERSDVGNARMGRQVGATLG